MPSVYGSPPLSLDLFAISSKPGAIMTRDIDGFIDSPVSVFAPKELKHHLATKRKDPADSREYASQYFGQNYGSISP